MSDQPESNRATSCFPGSGLWAQRSGPEFGDMVVFVAVPLVSAGIVALVWMRRHEARALLADPVPLVVQKCVLDQRVSRPPERQVGMDNAHLSGGGARIDGE